MWADVRGLERTDLLGLERTDGEDARTDGLVEERAYSERDDEGGEDTPLFCEGERGDRTAASLLERVGDRM